MRKAIPTPELISAGHWKKIDSKQGRVALTERDYYAPCDLSDSSVDIRKHEYAHIKYSEPRENTPIDIESSVELNSIMGSFEDYRVNYLLKTQCDVSVKHVGDNVYEELEYNIKKMPPMFAAKLYVSSRMYATPATLDKKLRLQFETTVDQVDALIEKLSTNPTIENMHQTCRDFKKLFDDDKKKQEENNEKQKSKPKEKEKKEEKKNEEKGEVKEGVEEEKAEEEKIETEEVEEGKIAAKMKRKYSLIENTNNTLRGESTLADFAKKQTHEIEFGEEQLAVAGEMSINFPRDKMKQVDKYKGVRLRPKRKASTYGAALRYTSRILTDKACFSSPMRDSLGTVLVDVSGSMNMDLDALMEMLKFSGRATVAMYSGGNYKGYKEEGDPWTRGSLYILSKGGRCISEIPQHAKENIIDAPALEWLCAQPGPRWWISDGLVTGRNTLTGPLISERCFKACVKGKVGQVRSVKNFMELMKTNKMRNYRKQYSILGLNTEGKWVGR